MVNWKDINPNFTEELTRNWQNQGFDFEQTKKWIEMGFSPNDYEVAAFIRGNLGYNAESPLSSEEIENLRSIYQSDFTNQSILLLNESLIEQEMIRQSIISRENDELLLQEALWASQQEEEVIREKKNDSDMGWLTDDNVEYILKNDEAIREAKEVQVRTDIANVYLQVEKAKRGELVDSGFWNSLDISKKYIILPLRIRGNHWSLLFFVNSKSANKVLWLRYISSHPSPDEVSEEVKEVGGFLKQALKRYGNNIFDSSSLKKIVLWDTPKQRNTWDCGVYLIKFIKFLSDNEYHKLKDLTITDQAIKEFREEWKKRIGERKWCKWDVAVAPDRVIKEVSAITRSQSSKERMIKESKEIDDNSSPLWKEEMEDKITKLKTGLQELAVTYSSLFNELKKTQEKNDQLEKKQELLQEEVFQLRTNGLTSEVQKAEKKLNKIVTNIKNRLEEEELLEEVLEAQKEFTLTNSSFVAKQLEKYKKKLIKNGIHEEEVKKVCEMKDELIKLQKKIEQQHLEARIEFNK